MKGPSRIEAARRRVQIARYTIVVAAASALAAGAAVARAVHPGTNSAQSTTRAQRSQSALPSVSSEFEDASGGSVSSAPSSSAPVIQSSGS
jgi:hypothetical protein